MERRLTTIMAADVVGFSRLMEKDEAGTLAALKRHRAERFDPAIARHRGRIVKLMGDGVLVEFASVVEAVECAIDLQDRDAADADDPIRLRIGVNLGDIIVDGDDIYGDGVNVAARLEALAEPGGICISDIVCDALGNHLEATFSDAGEQQLKNIDRPVRIWHWQRKKTPDNARDPSGEGANTATTRARIVVFPFDNMSADPDYRHLADGLCEDLTTALSKLDTLDVVSRTAAFSVKDGDRSSAVDAAVRLGAGYAIEGSVRVAGKRVRINAQLIEAAGGGHIWAEKYDGEIDDVFDLQDTITDKITTALEVHLSDGAQVIVWRAEAGNSQAYEHFLAGRAAYKEYSRAGNNRARRSYEAAIAVQPAFTSAIAGLARTHIEDAGYGWSTDRTASLKTAYTLLDEALEASPDHALARAELAHALMVDRKFEQGIQEANSAVSADPNLADAVHVVATLQVCLGQFDEAIANVARCLKLNPSAPEFYLVCKAEALVGAGRYDEALDVIDYVLARRRDWLMVHALKAIAHEALGQHAEAAAAVAAIRKRNTNFNQARWKQFLHYPDRADVPDLQRLLADAGLP